MTQEKYAASEISQALGISERAVRKRAAKERWPLKKRAVRLGGNHYYHATLPPDVKAVIAKYQADQAPKKIIDGAVIPDWSHRIGLARYQVVAAWRSFCGTSKSKKTEATEAFLLAYNGGQLVTDAFDIVGQIKKSTLYRWEGLLRDNGDDYYSICDQRGKWTKGGPKGAGQLSPAAAEAFLAAWLTPNQPSVTLAYNAMAAVLRKKDIEVPSLSSVHRFAKRFEELNYNKSLLSG